jgi:hypothetical protein
MSAYGQNRSLGTRAERGRSYVSERAELRGEKSFHIFVLPGAGSQHAQFDPSAWTYRQANAGTYTDEGMGR